MKKKETFVALSTVILILQFASPVMAGEGFGTPKLAVNLSRVRPPDVYIAGKKIAVRSSGQGSESDAARSLIAALESELLGNDPKLSIDETRPETLVEVGVIENEYEEHWETRTEYQSVEAGKDSKGKTIYKMREVSVRYKVVTHIFSAAYKVTDVSTGKNLDADTVTRNLGGDYREGSGAPNRAESEHVGVRMVVDFIAPRLTPTTEAVGVLLPKGSLKDLGSLAAAGLWNKYAEALEGHAPLPKGADDSYRKYALGVAYEALGYAAETPDVALNYFEQASMHYNEAISMNPKEKYFVRGFSGSGLWSGLKGIVGGSGTRKEAMPPLDRVSSALEQYQRLVDFEASDQEQIAALGGARSLDGESQEEIVDNTSVIEMVEAGLSEEIILTTLETAPAVKFDVSPRGLIQLSQAKVSPNLIKKMQDIAGKEQ